MKFSSFLILVSFIVSLIAIATETKKKDRPFPRNVTVSGWLLVALAATTAAGNFIQNRRAAAADAVEESLALRQLETAIYVLMKPYAADEPPEPTDRFVVVGAYGRAGVFGALCDEDLSQLVGRVAVAREYEGKTWGEFITDATAEGLNQIRVVQSAYGRLLGRENNLLIGGLTAHPWNEFLLAAKARVGNANTANPLCLRTPENARSQYIDLSNSYWIELDKLLTNVGRRYCALRQQLHIVDMPPLFLRYISGFFYIPDPKVTEPIMQTVCSKLLTP